RDGQSPGTLLAMVVGFSSKSDGDDPPRERPLTPQDQLFPLLIEEQQLKDRYGPNHPKVQAVHGRIKLARDLLVRPPSAWAGVGRISNPSHNPEPGGKGKAARGRTDWQSVPPADLVAQHVQILRQKLKQITTSEELLTSLFDREHT